MQLAYPTKARLRTRTGCLECRNRRKKCDEVSPQCGGCARKGLKCTWPSHNSQSLDRRRRGANLDTTINENLGTQFRCKTFRPDDHIDMYTHFATVVLPSMVRPNCAAEYNDQSYMLQLALDFPPLMAIMIGITAVHLQNEKLALESYLFSLHGLRSRMAHCVDAANEDAILASTILLCVMENLRSGATPNIGLHATAAGVILSRRSSSGIKQVDPFERLCVESFLYHSTLMMLFEPSLDTLQRVNPTMDLARYFTELPPPTSQPILDASYPFFFLIADVTRLARSTHPLTDTEILMYSHLLASLLHYDRNFNDGSPTMRLYLLTMRILLLKVDPLLSTVEATEQIHHISSNGFSILDSLNVNQYLLGFSLWPVAVLGSIATTANEQDIVQGKITSLARRQHGQTTRLRDRLKTIWATPEAENSELLVHRLHMLVKGV
ncbi:hypothetical protein BDV38DRAFT_272031 [Aspergillus pseudotamarii]|uniref:Zn(2)-C6 fungal-type domain-containing protein n=1 Tax=Aspergillus pseudotamarii TaxID=132259 RepID=A0A5N6SP15_ASPPS|nr:uncharacterized protein BDV38DRAFT_272031 [Aspergillus pseudotamarii]KAE8136432.1 hypothetical protein BDV38DRAFT_272031 [Aspergillus pseudotamarii]